MTAEIARIDPHGFREYDVRWRYPEDIDLGGMRQVGRGIGTQLRRRGGAPQIVVASDFRSYSGEVKAALIDGLIAAGIEVSDIGTGLSPTAYFARYFLGIDAVAMVTASHNPNGWTGVKIGFDPPLTHGPSEMAELKQIVLNGEGSDQPGGHRITVEGVGAAYLDDLAGDFRVSRRIRALVACGNGTAGFFAPQLLRCIGVEVIERHCTPDYSFPNYNPNPEAMEMLHDMAAALHTNHADLALGFDGDGDRCGVVDDRGQEISADKMGVLLAREMVRDHPGATFVVDVKSTGLFQTDPVLRAAGAVTDYWKTGHSHMKRRVQELRALSGFEKSGHYYLAPPFGRGYDCGLKAAVEIIRMLDRQGGRLSELAASLPQTWLTPTMSPHCPDAEKYTIVARISERLGEMQRSGERLGGQGISSILTVNGARVMLENGAWGLIRASSNTPNLVVVCESPDSETEMKAIFADLDGLIRAEPSVGPYDQAI